jgi:hypothetical protein
MRDLFYKPGGWVRVHVWVLLALAYFSGRHKHVNRAAKIVQRGLAFASVRRLQVSTVVGILVVVKIQLSESNCDGTRATISLSFQLTAWTCRMAAKGISACWAEAVFIFSTWCCPGTPVHVGMVPFVTSSTSEDGRGWVRVYGWSAAPRKRITASTFHGFLVFCQVVPLFESVMLTSGPQEVLGGAGASLGRTAMDSMLRVIPKPGHVSAHQLHLAAAISGRDQVGVKEGQGKGQGIRRGQAAARGMAVHRILSAATSMEFANNLDKD